jgi:hypothetical protein
MCNKILGMMKLIRIQSGESVGIHDMFDVTRVGME